MAAISTLRLFEYPHPSDLKARAQDRHCQFSPPMAEFNGGAGPEMASSISAPHFGGEGEDGGDQAADHHRAEHGGDAAQTIEPAERGRGRRAS